MRSWRGKSAQRKAPKISGAELSQCLTALGGLCLFLPVTLTPRDPAAKGLTGWLGRVRTKITEFSQPSYFCGTKKMLHSLHDTDKTHELFDVPCEETLQRDSSVDGVTWGGHGPLPGGVQGKQRGHSCILQDRTDCPSGWPLRRSRRRGDQRVWDCPRCSFIRARELLTGPQESHTVQDPQKRACCLRSRVHQ